MTHLLASLAIVGAGVLQIPISRLRRPFWQRAALLAVILYGGLFTGVNHISDSEWVRFLAFPTLYFPALLVGYYAWRREHA